MPRYFTNTSAGRPVVTGGYTFDFELVGHRGGSWSGILAVEDDSAASALLALNSPNIGEITEEAYYSEKKKTPQATQSSPISAQPWATPRPPQGVAVAERVGSLTPPPKASEVRVIESATLKSADIDPPEEELLKEVVKSKSRPQRAAA